MQNTSNRPISITQTDLNEIKHSRQHAEDFFKKRKIIGWPRVVTPEPHKHFLVS